MNALRAVLAKLTVLVDDKPVTALDRKIDKVKRNMAMLATRATATFAAAGYAAWNLTQAASDAEEAMNVLKETFKGNEQAVIEWSKKTGQAMGRSVYKLQDSVGQFGAFLQPMFKGTDVDIQKMSQDLTQLSVDLASFYNTSDQEAMMRLKSGMAGETEAVRRIGIDLSDEGLNQFNSRENGGDGRKMRQMSQAEKTWVRFRKIMYDTELAQNDAIKTAGSWANSLKRVEDKIHDLRVELGKKLLPYMLKLLQVTEKIVDAMGHGWEWLEEKTSILRTALEMLASLIVARGLQIIQVLAAQKGGWMALGKEIFAVGLEVGKAFAAFYVIEDIITFLRGGESVIGDFAKAMTGLEKPLEALEKVAERLVHGAMNKLMKMMNAMSVSLNWIFGDGKASVGDVSKGLVDLDERERDLEESRQTQWRDAVKRGDIQGALQHKRMGEGVGTAFDRALAERAGMFKSGELDESVDATDADIGSGLVDRSTGKTKVVQLPVQSVMGDSGKTAAAPVAYGSGYANTAANRGAKGKGQTLAPITINVAKAGATAEEIADAVRKAQDERDREAAAAAGEEIEE